MEGIGAGRGLQGVPCGRPATSGWKDPEDGWGVIRASGGGADGTTGAGKRGLSASGFRGQGGRLGEESRKEAQRGWHSRWVWISGNLGEGTQEKTTGGKHRASTFWGATGTEQGAGSQARGDTCRDLPQSPVASPSGPAPGRGQHCVLCADLSEWLRPGPAPLANAKPPNRKAFQPHPDVPSGPLELQAYSEQTDLKGT